MSGARVVVPHSGDAQVAQNILVTVLPLSVWRAHSATGPVDEKPAASWQNCTALPEPDRCWQDLHWQMKANFGAPVAVSGQTYPRKADYTIVAALGGVAVTTHRIANDIRLLSGLRELAEPFGKRGHHRLGGEAVFHHVIVLDVFGEQFQRFFSCHVTFSKKLVT